MRKKDTKLTLKAPISFTKLSTLISIQFCKERVEGKHYSETQLIRSPMGQTHLAVLTGGRINQGFLHENGWLFCWAAKKKRP